MIISIIFRDFAKVAKLSHIKRNIKILIQNRKINFVCSQKIKNEKMVHRGTYRVPIELPKKTFKFFAI